MRRQIFSTKVTFILLSTALIMISTILIVLFFLKGSKKVIGDFTDPVSSEALKCVAANFDYPFFHVNQPTQKNKTIINVIFDKDKIEQMSLIRTNTYNDYATASSAYTVIHANMNKSFSDNWLGPDALSADYSILNDNTVQMSLFAAKNELNTNSAKYFLIENFSSNRNKDNLIEYYTKKGFSCTLNNHD